MYGGYKYPVLPEFCVAARVKDVGTVSELFEGRVPEGHDDLGVEAFNGRQQIMGPAVSQCLRSIDTCDVIVWRAAPEGIGKMEVIAVKACTGNTVIQHTTSRTDKGRSASSATARSN